MFLLSTLNVYPYNLTLTVTNPAAGSFPRATYLDAVNSAAPTNKVAYIQQSFSRPYVEQFLFNIQQQIAKGTSIEIGYVGAIGVRQPTKSNDGNIVEPLALSGQLVWPTVSMYTTTKNSVTSAPKFNPFTGTKINPPQGQVDTTLFNQSTSYNAFNLSLRRSTQNMRIGASFTWAKSLDGSSSSNGGTNFVNSATVAPFPMFIGYFRGLSDFNVKLNLSVNVLYTIPGPKREGFVGALGKGWQVGGIGRSATGLPFTALISGDALGLRSASTYDFPNRLYGPGCEGDPVNPGNVYNYIKTQCFAYPGGINSVTKSTTASGVTTTTTTYNPVFGNEQKNSIVASGIQNIDFSLVKLTPINRIREGLRMELRAEIFNILNHPMFQVPGRTNTGIFSSVGAPQSQQVLTATSVPERQMQFGVKVIF